MIIYRKYIFNSQEQANTLIETLEENSHTIKMLGFLPLEIQDENSPIQHSTNYSVDVLWENLPLDDNDNPIIPNGWDMFTLSGKDTYKHTFLGWEYEL